VEENITEIYVRKNLGRLLDETAYLNEFYIICAGMPMATPVSAGRPGRAAANEFLL